MNSYTQSYLRRKKVNPYAGLVKCTDLGLPIFQAPVYGFGRSQIPAWHFNEQGMIEADE